MALSSVTPGYTNLLFPPTAVDAEQTILQRSQRTRTYRWLMDMNDEVKKTGKYLGLGA